MNVAILGSFDEVPLAHGWTTERAVAILGSVEVKEAIRRRRGLRVDAVSTR